MINFVIIQTICVCILLLSLFKMGRDTIYGKAESAVYLKYWSHEHGEASQNKDKDTSHPLLPRKPRFSYNNVLNFIRIIIIITVKLVKGSKSEIHMRFYKPAQHFTMNTIYYINKIQLKLFMYFQVKYFKK